MSSSLSEVPLAPVEGSFGRLVSPKAAYPVLVLLLIALGILAAHYHVKVAREATEAVLARRIALAQLASATLSERLERLRDVAVSLATRVRFAELVAAGKWQTAVPILREVPGELPYVERLLLTDMGGTVMADVPPVPGAAGTSFAERLWYRSAVREATAFVSPVYRSAAQRDVIAVATPVRERSSGRAVAMLVVELSLARVFEWARGIELAQGVSLVLVDGEGRVGYASSAATDAGTSFGVEQLRRGRSGAEVSGERLHAFVPAQQGWGVVIEQPARDAFAARDRQLVLVWVAYGLMALFLATATWVGARIAASRLAELRRARSALARHGERLRILHEIDGAIVAQRSPEAIAAAVIGPLRELLGVPRAIVNKFDLQAGEAEWIAAAGRRRMHVGPGVRYPMRLMGDVEALRRGEPQRIDVHALPAGPEREALLASDVHVYMVMPMIAGGELIGALSYGGASADFPAEQLSIAREVATQLAIAIAQARLHERVLRHAEELERRVAERTAALEAANREYEDLYNNAPCGYHSVDARGKFVRMNDTELKWLGYTREELIGRMGPVDVLTPRSLELFLHRFEHFRDTGVARDVEYDWRRKDGSVMTVLLNATAVRDADGDFVMSRSTVLDNTERKAAREQIDRLNAALRQRAAELEAANKELEGFSYSVSHDLRAPLRAVDGFARMVEEDYGAKLDDEGRRLLAVVRSSSKQMGQLIDDLLDFSRLGRLTMDAQPLDMTGLVREVAQALPQGNARFELLTLPAAHADARLLRQVWSNLISNALKYSGKRSDPRIQVGGREATGETIYWVRDNGVGFDMRYADKLFGVFQRLHSAEEFPGTGVGLAIVQRIVARHRGRVWAEARPDEGACFYFSLPREA